MRQVSLVGLVGPAFERILTDSPASSALPRERTGWQPTSPGLTDDPDAGRYFETQRVVSRA